MAALCRIEMLGRLCVRQEDREITRFRTQMTGSLLALLAYHLQQSHPRERLIEMLWPDSNPERGRNNLSISLSSLRHQLEPPGVPVGSVLIADRFNIRLNPEAVTTDVADFEDLLKSAARESSEIQRGQYLAEALECYRGELLPGCYEDWIIPERTRLADACLQALRQQTRHLVRRRDFAQALNYARQAVALDPLREEAHLDLMRLYVAAGQPGTAVRQYHELEQLLQQEFDRPPSQAAQRLLQEIEAGIQAAGEAGAPARPTEAQQPRSAPAPLTPLPTGVLTWLIAEITDSIALRERLRDDYKPLHETCRALLIEECRRHRVYRIGEAADAVMAAFGRPTDALACAIASQQAVAHHSWPAETDMIRLRMALDSGDAEPVETDSQSITRDRISRLLTMAHGGQILCSETVMSLLRRSPASEIRLVDIGLFRWRDMPTTERIFQAEYPGMPELEASRPQAGARHEGALPAQFTRFFGREAEQARLVERLLSTQTRLITLTGPGGTGKTRLSIEVAHRLLKPFAGAVWFVPLADVSDARLIYETIAGVMRLPRSPAADPLDPLVEELGHQPSLLILDNFEQLVEAGAVPVRTLLERVPTLKCLITSRQRLHIEGEQLLALRPLSTPGGADTPERLSMYESVRLFVDRAQTVRPDFQVTNLNAPAVAAVCDRLEGIPLAIELAAARSQGLTPAQMHAQLQNRFTFLVSRRRDAKERHRTLHAAIDWSYRLLEPELRSFCAQLSVFRGGWTVEAAEAICAEPLALDYIMQLHECSLLLAEEEGETMRFGMLETLREFAAGQVDAGTSDALAQRHAGFYRQMAQQAEAHLTGAEQGTWLSLLETEYDNLRAALRWYRSHDREAGLRLAGALSQFWQVRGYLSEGREYLRELLSVEEPAEPAEPNSVRARAFNAAGILAYRQGDYGEARDFYAQCLEIRRELGDTRGVAEALNNLGNISIDQGDDETARLLMEESLTIRRELNDSRGIAGSLNNLGLLACRRSDHAAAQTLYEEALRINRELGNRGWEAINLSNLGAGAQAMGDYPAAQALFEQSLKLRQELGDRFGIAVALDNLGGLARLQGDLTAARDLYRQSLDIAQELGDKQSIAYMLEAFATLALDEGRLEHAALLCGAAESLREQIDAPLMPAEQEDYDRTVDTILTSLGAERFKTARSRGRLMTIEQAVALALEV